MKVQYKVSGKMIIEIEAPNEKEMLEKLAHLDEVFGQDTCGACESKNVRFQVREVDGNKYYEVICKDCGAKLAFGQHKKTTTLFPRRGDKKKNEWYPNKGWVKFNKKDELTDEDS